MTIESLLELFKRSKKTTIIVDDSGTMVGVNLENNPLFRYSFVHDTDLKSALNKALDIYKEL